MQDAFRDLFVSLAREIEIERRARKLLQELRAQMCTEVFDPQRVRESVMQGMKQAVGEWPLPVLDRRQDELIGAVLEAEDVRAMERVLDRANVMLPFVEQLPVRSERETVWRPLMEVKSLRRKPLDDARFRYVLDRLDRLIRRSGVSTHPKSNRDAADAVLRLRRALESQGTNFGHFVRLVEQAVEVWLEKSHIKSAQSRLEELEKWIEEAGELRTRLDGIPVFPLLRRRPAELAALEAERLAGFYRERDWMHRPAATRTVVAILIDAEIARMPFSSRRAWTTVLRRTRSEIAGGNYDRNEILRRVQKLEDGGLYLHSFVSALLRLNDRPKDRSPAEAALETPLAEP